METPVKERLKAIVIDDEWLIREELKTMLNKYDELQIAGEAGTITEAALIIEKIHPDIIFLDIQLQGETGFDLFDITNIDCNVVFVTAYDEYAIKAFEVNAVDYLLKPVMKDRLDKTIDRILTKKENTSQSVKKQMELDDTLYLMVNDSFKFIKIKSIKCILAEGNYSYIIIHEDKKELVTKTLKEWQCLLPEKDFVRIHRSSIININHIHHIEQRKNYTNLVFINEVNIPFEMSRRYAAKLKTSLTLELSQKKLV